MITLSASGGSVTFTFDGNSTYLNDGQITVPVNSLALIIDESDMATFRKAASNDIFVSANIAEFGMTKDELESWYKANMVGATGGGSGSGVTPSEVQTMIDESISGKADSNDVYTTGQTSGATEIANALNAKLDATAYTPTVVDAALSQSSTNPVQNQALYGELRVGGGTSKVEIDFNTGGYVPEGVTQLEVNPTTTDSWANYNFYNGNTKLGYYHFTNWNWFEVDNYLEGSSYVTSGETVIITYPASLGVTRIAQDAGNAPWSFKAIVETPAVPLKDAISGKADSSAVTEEISAAVSGKADTSYVDSAVSGKTDTTTYSTYTAATDAALATKQTTLTAGTGISIVDNVISATGGGTVESAITSGSTNAVESSAIWSATTYNKEVTLQWDDGFPSKLSTKYPSGCKKFVVTVPSNKTAVIMLYNNGRSIGGSITISNYSSPSVSIDTLEGITYTISGNDVTFVVPDTITFDQLQTDIRSITSIKAIVEGAWIADNTYMKSEVDAIQNTLQNNINQKLDSTAYTPTVVDAALSQSSTNPVQNQALYSELRISNGGETETTLVIENNHSTNYPEGCTKLKVEVVGSNNWSSVGFINDNQNLGNINIFNYDSISVDNNYFQAATYEISGTTVIISYPTVTNVTKISVSGDGNHIYKAVTTEPPTVLKDQVVANTTALGGKTNQSDFTAYTASTDAALSGKQDTLSAGTGIEISGNVISATGGGGGMTEDMERLISTALVDLNDRKIDASEVKSNYQKKGDYATKSALDLKANSSEVMTLDKSKENELVTAAALNSINERLIALETAVQALQTLHNNE